MRGMETVLWGVIVLGVAVGVPTAIWVSWQGKAPAPTVERPPQAPAPDRPASKAPPPSGIAATRAPASAASPAPAPAPAPAVATPAATTPPPPWELAELARLRRAVAEIFGRISEEDRPETKQAVQRQYEEAERRFKEYEAQLRARYGTLPAPPPE